MSGAAQTRVWGRPAVLVVALAVASVAAFLLWANWAALDQIARAQGQVIPTGRIQLLQSSDGGVISRILVHEGDTVKRGQLLMTLEKVKLEAGVEESRAKAAALRAAVARLQAELFDRPLEFPPEVRAYPEFVANQTQLYHKRRQALSAGVEALQRQLALARDELALNAPLVETGDVARADVIRLQRQIADLQGQIVNLSNKYFQEGQAEMTKAEEDAISAEQLVAQRRSLLESTDVFAPTDGIVKNVRLTTIGGVLRAGDEIMQIVPTDDALIVEARVLPSDIAFVRTGQRASVKFDAYDSSIYGAASGEVIYVSPDSIAEPKRDGSEQLYFRVHLAIDARGMKPRLGEGIKIQPGMAATAEIRTGKNTVLGFLTKPLTKTLSTSLQER